MTVHLLVASGSYVDWGIIQISLTNLLIIVAMIAVFVAALLVPFPDSHRDSDESGGSDE
ncbi:MAG: hypothetical protein ABI206_03070 [Antricoccus sp.]